MSTASPEDQSTVFNRRLAVATITFGYVAFFVLLAVVIVGSATMMKTPAPVVPPHVCPVIEPAPLPPNPWPKRIEVVCPHCRNHLYVYPGSTGSTGQVIGQTK